MKPQIPDLWPDDLFGSPLMLPVAILRKQGEALAAKTRHLVTGLVESQTVPPGDQFEHTFVLVAAVLHFRYPLLRVTHGAQPFPATVAELELTRQQSVAWVEQASSDDAFLHTLRSFFHTDRVIALLRSLIGQSADHTRPLYTEREEHLPDEGSQPLIVSTG